MEAYTVLMDCCVNFGSQTICATPSGRCCDKDFLPNTNYRAAHSSEYSPQPRIRHIFVAPACLKLDYKVHYNPYGSVCGFAYKVILGARCGLAVKALRRRR